ncbi:MAG: imidazole glycerol phosphate synthase subunit HisH [Hyphomicrobiales bacterium]|nr:imidazole glycerol phosphate synthase subunit HisH [Hyphomicrobiales bacterium]
MATARAGAARPAAGRCRGRQRRRPGPRGLPECAGGARLVSVAIVDYGSGNLHSAAKAFERAAREENLASASIKVTSDPDIVRRADRVVLPGVGAFADCKAGLAAVPGMIEAMGDAVLKQGKPFLGICVGMQLLATRGLENGVFEGLDWVPGDVVRISPSDPAMKIPHMGWNTLGRRRDHALLADVPLGASGLHAYFVHSYRFAASHAEDIVAETDYGGAVAALIAHGNIAGTQFHPEKSQTLGLKLIGNFLRWSP